MASNPPEFSESTWLGATVSVGGLMCGIVGVAAIIWNSPLVLLAIAAGSGWSLSIVFAVLYAAQRRQVNGLENDLAAARHQSSEWSATSNNIAQAVRAVLELAGAAPAPARRRARAKSDPGEPHDT